jgi:hypothetical protein
MSFAEGLFPSTPWEGTGGVTSSPGSISQDTTQAQAHTASTDPEGEFMKAYTSSSTGLPGTPGWNGTWDYSEVD